MEPNNTDYYDIAEIKQKVSKKSKKANKQNYSRVAMLNQTEYFTTR